MLPFVRDALLLQQRRRQNLELVRNRQEIRHKSNPFNLPDERFRELFRLNKELARHLINEVVPILEERQSLKGVHLDLKVLCALRFYATGEYQRSLGQDFNFGMSQTTVNRCIKAVTAAIFNLSNHYINMPTSIEERNDIKRSFMIRYGFPGVIGIIDGTHIPLLKPNQDEQNFINRKGYHSINCQVIIDNNKKIRNIWANYGGSTHDSFIWRHSVAQDFLKYLYEGHERSWLVGDSGYPLQPYLMIPFRNPQNQSEQNFNSCLTQARNQIEVCFGLLKTRFRCLLKENAMRYSPEFVSQVTVVCGILHNMCIENNIPLEEELLNEEWRNDLPVVDIGAAILRNEGQRIRDNLLNLYF